MLGRPKYFGCTLFPKIKRFYVGNIKRFHVKFDAKMISIPPK
jgi:hypothetical protein